MVGKTSLGRFGCAPTLLAIGRELALPYVETSPGKGGPFVDRPTAAAWTGPKRSVPIDTSRRSAYRALPGHGHEIEVRDHRAMVARFPNARILDRPTPLESGLEARRREDVVNLPWDALRAIHVSKSPDMPTVSTSATRAPFQG